MNSDDLPPQAFQDILAPLLDRGTDRTGRPATNIRPGILRLTANRLRSWSECANAEAAAYGYAAADLFDAKADEQDDFAKKWEQSVRDSIAALNVEHWGDEGAKVPEKGSTTPGEEAA